MTMNWRFIRFLISFFTVCLFLNSCVQSEYTKLVRSELAKGVRYDSILLGIRFGDTQKEFREKCFALNRKHLTTEGVGYAVRYIITYSLFHKAPTNIQLLFSPSFDEKEILFDMDLRFSYSGWAPWNRSYQSDSLEIKVIKMLEGWYKGNRFVTAHVGDKEIPVKVDGNRRILVLEEKPQMVIVKVQDILHPKYKNTIK